MSSHFSVQLPELPEEVNSVKAMVRGEIDSVEPLDYYYTQEQMRTFAAEAVANVILKWQAEMGEPQAWIRHCGNGMFEGPLSSRHSQYCKLKLSEWTPLYPMPLSIRSEP